MDTRNIVKNNALSTSEVAEILEVTKQTVLNYVNEGKLAVLKKSQSGHIFYKPDVLKFRFERMGNSLYSNQKSINQFNGSTSKTVKYFMENISNQGEFNRISIYFNLFDAIIDGHFKAKEPIDDFSGLHSITAPTFVMKTRYNEEWWFNGCNCGYGGEGPHGSETILRKLGIEQEMIDKLFYSSIVKYIKGEIGWEIIAFKEKYEDYNRCESVALKGVDVDILLKDDNLVMIQEYSSHWDFNLKALIEHYRKFIPEAEEIHIYQSKESAKDAGYYYSQNQLTYQVIVIDKSGRELWLYYPLSENEKLSSNKEIVGLIQACGLNSKSLQENGTFINLIKKWLIKNDEDSFISPVVIRCD